MLALSVLMLMIVAGCNSDDPVSPEPSGTFVINPSPDILDAPWTLTGPNSYEKAASGDQTLNNLSPGEYTIVWDDVTGWIAPAQEARTLADGGIETITGTYTGLNGIIAITVTPSDIDAAWTLVGPGNFNTTGQGSIALSNMAVGQYTLTCTEVTDWVTPAPLTIDVVANVMTSFDAIYVKKTGYIIIDAEPDYLNPRWHIYGPDFSGTGYGDSTLVEMEYGEYFLSWGPYVGWLSPESISQTLADPGVLTFEGFYTEEAVGFANSEDQLMLNFQLAYEEMAYNSLRDLLHPDFLMVLSQTTQEEFPDVGQFFDLTEELRIGERMLAGQSVTDPDGNLIPGISSVYFAVFEKVTPWATSSPADVIPNTRFALYDVNIWLDRTGFSTLKVEGAIKFYAAGRDSLHNGSLQTYYEMIGQVDLTGNGLNKVATANWGSVKALFR